MLSWGPPHEPYHTAPEEFKDLYREIDIKIPENVPEEHQEKARKQLRGYYSHISALDQCLKMITKCLERNQLERNTLVVLTSDHGDMLFSQGLTRKLYPFEESVRGARIFIIGSTHPSSENLKEMLLMLDAAKRASARHIFFLQLFHTLLSACRSAAAVSKFLNGF